MTIKRQRKARSSKRLQNVGGEWGSNFRARLRALIKARGQGQSKFALACQIEPSRLSEWLSGDQMPNAESLRRIAELTDVSLDWLLLGSGGTEPAYRSSSRAGSSLELDLALEIRRHIQQREAEGAFDLGGGSRLAVESWSADGTGLLSDLRRMEEAKVRRWLEWESRTLALRGIADDVIDALRAMVPFLPADDTGLGAHVQFLGRAALEAREFGAGLGVPEAPNCYRNIRMVDRSHSVVGPKDAFRWTEREFIASQWDEPQPLAERVAQGAILTPMRAWGTVR